MLAIVISTFRLLAACRCWRLRSAGVSVGAALSVVCCACGSINRLQARNRSVVARLVFERQSARDCVFETSGWEQAALRCAGRSAAIAVDFAPRLCRSAGQTRHEHGGAIGQTRVWHAGQIAVQCGGVWLMRWDRCRCIGSLPDSDSRSLSSLPPAATPPPAARPGRAC